MCRQSEIEQTHACCYLQSQYIHTNIRLKRLQSQTEQTRKTEGDQKDKTRSLPRAFQSLPHRFLTHELNLNPPSSVKCDLYRVITLNLSAAVLLESLTSRENVAVWKLLRWYTHCCKSLQGDVDDDESFSWWEDISTNSFIRRTSGYCRKPEIGCNFSHSLWSDVLREVMQDDYCWCDSQWAAQRWPGD